MKSIIESLNPFSGKKTDVQDAIIRPNGDVIRTDPKDTILATQTPNAVGGGLTQIFNGVTPRQMLNEMKREFGRHMKKIGYRRLMRQSASFFGPLWGMFPKRRRRPC